MAESDGLPDVRKGPSLVLIGACVMLLGCLVAYFTQTAGGIRIQDVRFAGTGAAGMSALLYVPPNATPQTPAPGILSIHGYFNSREAQDGFAIEFARRGYVVLAVDQRGHGYSDPPAFANLFGGPDGLKFLRSLDVVDKNNIGLEGHSMGGWAVMNAAAAIPGGYQAIVLEGSSTGAPFAPEGTSVFPRNLAVVFSQFDEFPQIMWGVPRADEVAQSAKLARVFGVQAPVQAGRLYGSVAEGTARMLYTPGGTHPMDHISTAAIGDSLDWFQRTLHGGTPRLPSDQIWYWKELGTFIALVGFVVFLLGLFDLLHSLPHFSALRGDPLPAAEQVPTSSWLSLALAAFIGAVTLLPLCELGGRLIPPAHWYPQSFTNEVAVWAVLNAVLLAAISFRRGGYRGRSPLYLRRCALLALLTVGIGYVAVAAAGYFFTVDFRIWFVALKPMSPAQMRAFVSYLIPFTIYFFLVLPAIHARIRSKNYRPIAQYVLSIAALAAGPIAFLLVQYGSLFTRHQLIAFFPYDPLRIILCIGVVPALATAGIISTFAYRRTNDYVPGAMVCALLVTWYVVAAQATHAS